jgi:hypothetical protein
MLSQGAVLLDHASMQESLRGRKDDTSRPTAGGGGGRERESAAIPCPSMSGIQTEVHTSGHVSCPAIKYAATQRIRVIVRQAIYVLILPYTHTYIDTYTYTCILPGYSYSDSTSWGKKEQFC